MCNALGVPPYFNTKGPTRFTIRMATILQPMVSLVPSFNSVFVVLLEKSSSLAFPFSFATDRHWHHPLLFLTSAFIQRIASCSVPTLSINLCQKRCARRGTNHLQRQRQTFGVLPLYTPYISAHFPWPLYLRWLLSLLKPILGGGGPFFFSPFLYTQYRASQ